MHIEVLLLPPLVPKTLVSTAGERAQSCLLRLLLLIPILFSPPILFSTGVRAAEAPPLVTGMASETVTGDVRIRLSARQETILSAEMSGKIIDLPFKEGERFKEGARLVAFDCTVHRARADHAAAMATAASRKNEVAGRLDRLDAISGSDVDQSAADLAMAQAELAIARAMVDRCVVVAPFAGRLADRTVQRWEYVQEGTKLLTLVDDSAFELDMLVPSRWLVWLKPGVPFTIRLDETGQRYPAEITRLGARIDPVSQTVRVFARLPGAPVPGGGPGLLAGMSGTADLQPPPTAADDPTTHDPAPRDAPPRDAAGKAGSK